MPDKNIAEFEKTDEPVAPYGKRIIGVESPEKKTKEEFESSKELLFHGSKEPFNYDLKFAYDANFYTTQDGSLTLGTGFYSTPDAEQAANYSYVRQSHEDGHPLNTISLLPKNAIMLDLRERNKLDYNAPIPKEIFEKWREKYVRYYKDQDRSKFPWYINQFETDYLQHLDKLAQFSDIDLRAMLWTGPDKRIGDGYYPSPPWVELFTQFMRDEGYDGVIYIEGGEGEKGRPSPTYCFYNLEKIGTYDTWHQKGI